MGERREMPQRESTPSSGARHGRGGAGERGRVTPFPLRRGASSSGTLRPARTPPPAPARRGGVGVDLRAGRAVLPPLPTRPQPKETQPKETQPKETQPKETRPKETRPKADPAAIYSPTVATAPPIAPPSRLATGRRPARRSRRIALIALICAQVLVAATAAWALTTPRFQTRRIEVAGTSDALVVRRIQSLPLTGCNIFHCDTAALARQVERLPAVERATVSTVYPDGLLVRVTPRQPALLWHTSASELVIASDGTVLGATTDDPAFAHLALPRIEDGPAAAFAGTTPAAGTRLDPLLVNMAAQLRTGMPGVLGAGWALDYDARSGFVAVKSSGGGGSSPRVLFGMPRDAAQAADDTPNVTTLLNAPTPRQVTRGVSMQLAELHALLALLAGQGQQAALIDLRWGAHPYYRLAS